MLTSFTIQISEEKEEEEEDLFGPIVRFHAIISGPCRSWATFKALHHAGREHKGKTMLLSSSPGSKSEVGAGIA